MAFTDFGHSKFTVTIASFIKGKLKILASASDRNLGARVMDSLILEKYGGEFNDKYGADPRKVPKCRLRMFDAIEKLRKTLSGNKEGNLNIECLLEDEDIMAHIKREDFEAMIAPLMERVSAVCKIAIEQAALSVDKIHAVELVGEATRIPIF